MNKDIFSSREDVARAYSNRRKNFPVEEAEDLLNCIIGYIKEKTKDKKTYAIKLGDLGYMHKKYDEETKTGFEPQSNHTIIDKMVVESCMLKKHERNPLFQKTMLKKEYNNLTIKEIQDIQNVEKD